VVITGGTKGLGKAMSDICAERGANVVISSHTHTPESNNEKITGVQSDVRKEEDIKKLKDFALEKFGKIDVWINNAGVWYPHMSIEESDMDRVHDVFEINVFGVMYGSRAAMTEMRKQGNGIIMNIISSAALGGRPTLSGYSASKFAEDGFTKAHVTLDQLFHNLLLVLWFVVQSSNEFFIVSENDWWAGLDGGNE
jgi:NAD(P)-dependent dehydrogenase (short-subunit alcohol dehydrogenase family)